MNRILYSLALFLCVSNTYAADITFSGKIIDAQTKEVLPGANITIQDLRVSTISDMNGKFSLNRIPENGKFLVQVSYLGYKYLNKTIDFATTQSFVFELQQSRIEANEVVLTGTVTGADNKKNSTSVGVLSHDEMLNRPATNLIDAVSKVAGVTQISTGQAISKPVIRGLSFNRIVTISDGVKQQGQQWGDEHGIEIDQFSADRVEVLRGAASLLYGADALGGVINILEPLTVNDGVIKGELLSNYSTNGGLSSNSAMLTGNTNGFVWRGRATYKNAYSFKTPDYYLPNSGFNETSLSAMLGLNKSWGYSHVNISSFKNNIGFYDPELDGNGNFIDEGGNPFTNSDLKSRTLALPNQQISHFKVASNSNILLGKGSLKLDLGYQNNIRKEFEDVDPALFFDLNSYSVDAKYIQNSSANGWQPVVGLSADYQNSLNKGEEFLVPDYNNVGLGVFYYMKKDFAKSSFNFGLRYDYRKNTGKQLFDEGVEKFSAFKTDFSNLSGAVGYTHQISDKLNFKANLSSGFRAPNPAEQASNGVHEGTFRYEVGDNNLKSEKSYQADLSLQYSVSNFDFSLSIYNNYMKDYIYLGQNNGETITVDHNGIMDVYPLFRYQQDDANFYGSDASLIFHPFEFLHFENTFSYVYAQNLGLKEAVPFIPAASLKNEIQIEPNIKGLKRSYFSVGLESNFAQDRIANFESRTAAYTLLQAGIGTQIAIGKQNVRFNISANNLLDKRYYNHLSRYKPGRLDETNPNFGIYNPGRNITFGLYVPLNIK
ncbi:TonB-dependent receptor [Pedobacter arcticus]|uniref:TonB-dependent receptor n=1 Tax=Pedobacter arcticus TaxID=752140 RepID=UPI0002F53802|nr:TonB-dependent receptor [Pedobacter arcticus]